MVIFENVSLEIIDVSYLCLTDHSFLAELHKNISVLKKSSQVE